MNLKLNPLLVVLTFLLYLEVSVKAQVTKDVRYYNLNGKIQQPLNFFQTNIHAGANISIDWNPISGAITINGGAGGGTNTLIQVDGIDIGSVGTLNFIGATGAVIGGTVVIGGFSGVSSGGLTTNDNQFLGVPLSIKDRAYVTNLVAHTGLMVSNGWFLTTGVMTNRGAIYWGGIGGTEIYSFDNLAGAYRLFLVSGSSVYSMGTNESSWSWRGVQFNPSLNNITDFGDPSLRWQFGYFGDLLDVSNALRAGYISITNIPGTQLGFWEVRSTNGNSYTRFSRVDDNWKPTNYFKDSSTNWVPGQSLVAAAVTYSGGEATIILTNLTITSSGGGLTTNANQFLGVPLSIIDGAALTNIHVRSSSGGPSRVALFDTNVLVITNGFVGVRGIPTNRFHAWVASTDDGIQVQADGLANYFLVTPQGFSQRENAIISIDMLGSQRWSFQNGTYNFLPTVNGGYSIGDGTRHVLTNYGFFGIFRERLSIGSNNVSVTFGVTNAVATTNLFVFSVTNPVAGQVLSFHNVQNLAGGQVVIVLTNTTLSASGGGLTTNASQFLGVPLSIIDGAFLTNPHIRSASGLKQAMIVNTNTFIITNGLVGIHTTAPNVSLAIGSLSAGDLPTIELNYLTNRVYITDEAIGTITTTPFNLMAGGGYRWGIRGTVASSYPFYPVSSNVSDIGMFDFVPRTNYTKWMRAYDGFQLTSEATATNGITFVMTNVTRQTNIFAFSLSNNLSAGQTMVFHSVTPLANGQMMIVVTNGAPPAVVSAAGDTSDVQFNEGDVFAGTNEFRYDRNNNRLSLRGNGFNVSLNLESSFSESIINSSNVSLNLAVQGVTRWRVANADTDSVDGDFVPHLSNTVSFGSPLLPIKTNFAVRYRSLVDMQIDQRIGKTEDALVYMGSNGAPIITINSNGFLVTTQTVTGMVRSPTNTLAQGVENYAGRLLPSWYGQMGLYDSPQPALFNNRVMMMIPASGSAAAGFGMALGTAAGGTVVSHPPSDTEGAGLPYMFAVSSAATSNSVGGLPFVQNIANSGAHNGSYSGGYFFSCEWADTNLINGVVGGGAGRHFVGMTATANVAWTNIANTTNATGQYVGLMADLSQSLNMFITVRDGSAEFRTNTGVNFVASNLYNIYFFQSPTNRFLNWKLRNLTAQTSAFGWFSNNVPTNFMKGVIMTKNGTNRANSIRASKLYIEAPIAPQ